MKPKKKSPEWMILDAKNKNNNPNKKSKPQEWASKLDIPIMTVVEIIQM